MSDKLYEFRIPVSWSMTGVVYIEARNLDDAIESASSADLPDGEYMDGSWEVDQECAEEFNISVLKQIEQDKRPIDHIVEKSFNITGE
jgi:hypothetical protein